MPKSEALAEVSDRVGYLWDEVIQPALDADLRMLVVAHEDTVRVLQGMIKTRNLGGPARRRTPSLPNDHPAQQFIALRDSWH